MKAKTSTALKTLAALSLSVAAGLPAAAEETVLRGVSCFPIGSPPSVPFEKMVEEINERGAGVVKIDLLGGAPAIGSPFQVGERTALGLYDIIGCPEAYMGSLVPEAEALHLSDFTHAELRENGGMAMMQSLFAEKGIKLLGRHHNDGTFNLYTAEKLEGPDLSGMNIRISPPYASFYKALGATVQRSTGAEVYTLMENKTVDGYGWSLRGISPAWYEVTGYLVEPGIYEATIQTYMNLAKFDGLPEDARALVEDIVLEYEAANEPGSETQAALNAAKIEEYKEAGIEVITFEGDVAENWLSIARDEGWKEFVAANPENGAKLQELFTK